MEQALKETLRDLERKSARQETGGRSVSEGVAGCIGLTYLCVSRLLCLVTCFKIAVKCILFILPP